MSNHQYQELGSMLLVGALWGCTNPLLRQGSLSVKKQQQQDKSTTLTRLLNLRLWLPYYLLNQCGSILFYVTLRQSDLTLAVPLCNALALVCSVLTSFALGEAIPQPIRTIVGAALVLMGVTICVV